MKKQIYGSWDMAGLRSRTYVTPKPRVVHGVVGKKAILPVSYAGPGNYGLDRGACHDCGHHKCSCASAAEDNVWSRSSDCGFSYNGYRVWTNPGLTKDSGISDEKNKRMVVSPECALRLRPDVTEHAYVCAEHGRSIGGSCRFCDYEKHVRMTRDAVDAMHATPVFVEPWPLREERGLFPRFAEIDVSTGKKRVVVYNPSNSKARDRAYEMCEKLNAQAVQAAEKLEGSMRAAASAGVREQARSQAVQLLTTGNSKAPWM